MSPMPQPYIADPTREIFIFWLVSSPHTHLDKPICLSANPHTTFTR
jgi:hypothetical protein